jgi:hypothetical protein
MLKNRCSFPIKIVFTLILIFSLSISKANAQIPKDVKNNLKILDSKHVQIITTQDKSTMIGRIVKIGEQEIQFKTEFGEITIPIQKIKSIEIVPASSIKSGKYWFPNPNATRLFIGSTARMLKKGDGYFADSYLFFPSIAYGISNNITIGGGMSLIPGVDPDKQLFYFTPKIGLTAIKNLNFATGALIIKIPDFDDDDDDDETPLVGVLNFVGTYGTANSSFTLGLGYGFADDEFADKPMVLIGGEHRIARRLALVTENWLLPGVDEPLISYGMRFFGEKISVDLAFLNVLSNDMIFPGIPYVDFVFNF